MSSYFKNLNFRNRLKNLKQCRLMNRSEFSDGVLYLKSKKIVIIGCGSQGLNQGLNMRDSGLDVSFALRKSSIQQQNQSWKNAIQYGFDVNTYEKLIPQSDLIINLTPDKQHSDVIKTIMPLMKKNSILGFSHGFYIVEINDKIRKDITVIMVAPKCPGTEVRAEFLRNFGVPTLIAVHTDNDMNQEGLQAAKAWAVSLGSHKAGVLDSSFSAEVKSDLMGEQTILCGILQSASLTYYDKLIADKIDSEYASKLIQNGWEVFTESLKHGGITLMLDRLSNINKIKAYSLSEKLKNSLRPLFCKHMDDIIDGTFASNMIQDWAANDDQLIYWRNQTKKSCFEQSLHSSKKISEQEYFDNGTVMISILKAGVELAFEVMTESGITESSAYYESLHELPLIANTIARKRLYEMNVVISDTAEYGNYLFSEKAIPILTEFMSSLDKEHIPNKISKFVVTNQQLNIINENIRNHPIEIIGKKLRFYMNDMKTIAVG